MGPTHLNYFFLQIPTTLHSKLVHIIIHIFWIRKKKTSIQTLWKEWSYTFTSVCLLLALFSSVQLLSRVWLLATPWTAACQASLSINNSQSLLKIMSIKLVMPSSHLNPRSSHSPPALNPSQNQGLFQWVSSSHQVAKLLEFQLQHQSFQWIFRTDFL